MERVNNIVMIRILGNQKEATEADITAFGMKPRNLDVRCISASDEGKESFSSLFHDK